VRSDPKFYQEAVGELWLNQTEKAPVNHSWRNRSVQPTVLRPLRVSRQCQRSTKIRFNAIERHANRPQDRGASGGRDSPHLLCFRSGVRNVTVATENQPGGGCTFIALISPRIFPSGANAALRFRFSLQLDVPVGEFDGEFDVLALILLSDLFGLFLHEVGEGIEIAGDILARLFLGRDQRVV
jgi:hypothetical protein